jgi:tetratricopeptide (TPR) repeat protein
MAHFCTYVVSNSQKLYRYREKTFQQQLELLFQRDLYVLAINLAQKLGADVSQQNVIYRKYGDYLYQKQDYDTAMQQYLRAIDNTEPSQIIRKVFPSPSAVRANRDSFSTPIGFTT